MKYTILLIAIAIVIFTIPIHFSEPGFNVTSPGCSGSICHALEVGLVSASVTGLEVAIMVNTTSSVGGELVDANGTVVDFNNSTGNNPFTLTAPGPGIYTVNAGFKNPFYHSFRSHALSHEKPSRSQNLFPISHLSGSTFSVFNLLTRWLQALLPSPSPAQTVFSLQKDRVVVSFHSDDIYLPGYLVFKPVPYFHHDAASFPGNHDIRMPEISLPNFGLPVLPFFQDPPGRA